MSQNLIESTQARLGPVHEAIAAYDKMRPLNAAARMFQGLEGAWQIAMGEARELVDIRQQADFIPSDRLNGQRQMVKEELGDLVFGVAEILRYLPVEAMNLDQLEVVLGWNRLIWETGIHYGLDWVKAGVEVNMDKNQANNPTWAYQFHHPFDNQVKTRDENDWVRRGLRIIRDVDPGGKLKQSNLERVITYFGYTQEVLQDSPSLASHFLRQVAINGFSVVG